MLLVYTGSDVLIDEVVDEQEPREPQSNAQAKGRTAKFFTGLTVKGK